MTGPPIRDMRPAKRASERVNAARTDEARLMEQHTVKLTRLLRVAGYMIIVASLSKDKINPARLTASRSTIFNSYLLLAFVFLEQSQIQIIVRNLA